MYFSSNGSGTEDDAELIRQTLAGETDAFGTLATRYQHLMYTVALRMVGNAEDAQDVTQDAFVKAYRQLATFDPQYKFFSWMYRIVINECFNVIRARRPQVPLDSELAGQGNPFETAVATARHADIEAALQHLTPEYRAVVVLRYFGGQGYSDIATTLSIPEKTVKSRLFTARQRLGEMLFAWREPARKVE